MWRMTKEARWVLRLLGLTALIWASTWPASGALGDAPFVLRARWGGEGYQLAPSDVTIAPDGSVFVLNSDLNRVTRIETVERTFSAWGESGNGLGQMTYPRGLAIGADGFLYIADTGNHRIQVFDQVGHWVRSWGLAGSGPGEFNAPTDAAVAPDGMVYVMDRGNNRIQKFDASGNFLLQWGTSGSGNGQFNCSTSNDCGLTVDANHAVIIADTGNHRVQRFSSDGHYLAQWGTYGSAPGEFSSPSDVAVDGAGQIFVVDPGNCRIQILAASGGSIRQWGTCGQAAGQFGKPSRLAVDRFGSVYVTDLVNYRVSKFSNAGQYLRHWGQGDQIDDTLGVGYVLDVALDQPRDRLYLADSRTSRIMAFDLDGNFLAAWKRPDPVYHPDFIGPETLGVDGSGNVYLGDTYEQAIWKFDNQGQLLLRYPALNPQEIAVTSNGEVYGIDLRRYVLFHYSSVGDLLGTVFDQYGPTAPLLGPAGAVYTRNSAGIRVYSPELVLSNTLPITTATGLAFSPGGALFVSTGNGDILELNADGSVRNSWPSLDTQPWTLHVAAGLSGPLVVNNRRSISVYGPMVRDPRSGAVFNGAFDSQPILDGWRIGGELPVGPAPEAYQGTAAVRLGSPVPQAAQGQGQAWIQQTLYIDPAWAHPELAFSYRAYVNDIRDYSDFFVELLGEDGLSHLATLVRDGFMSCDNAAPGAGTDLGWQTRRFDLSPWKGQAVRLMLSVRNLWPDSLGMWVDIDDVRLIDSGPKPAYRLNLVAMEREASPTLCP